MLINTFTLIDAVNQFWKVCENGDRRSLTSTGLTYFYLCNVWNTCGRPISFRRQNTLICAELIISKPTMERHRNALKQAGLIDFFSKGKGDPNITYQIIDVFGCIGGTKNIKQPPFKPPDGMTGEVKKEKIFTSGVTSPVTSGDAIKQSTEIFIVVDGEVKNFIYLQNLFLEDAGLVMHWKNQDFAAEKFSHGLELWMIQNHKSSYVDFDKARKHFLFWIPNYNNEANQSKNGPHKGITSTKITKSTGANELLSQLKDELESNG